MKKTHPIYTLNLRNILPRKLKNIGLTFLPFFVLGLLPHGYIFSSLKSAAYSNRILSAIFSVVSVVLIISFFPIVLTAAGFIGIWILKVSDVLLFWIKTIDVEAKTINGRIKYEDFYLLEYDYSVSESRKNKVIALLILTERKKAITKILCEFDRFDRAPNECREFIRCCREKNKHIYIGSKRFPARHKIFIGKSEFINWSYFHRIFLSYPVWTLLFCAVLILEMYLVLGENIFW